MEGAQLQLHSARRGAIAYLAAFLMGQLAAWGLGSGALVLRADIKAPRAESLVERTAVESHQSIGAVERMNREVAGTATHA